MVLSISPATGVLDLEKFGTPSIRRFANRSRQGARSIVISSVAHDMRRSCFSINCKQGLGGFALAAAEGDHVVASDFHRLISWMWVSTRVGFQPTRGDRRSTLLGGDPHPTCLSLALRPARVSTSPATAYLRCTPASHPQNLGQPDLFSPLPQVFRPVTALLLDSGF